MAPELCICIPILDCEVISTRNHLPLASPPPVLLVLLSPTTTMRSFMLFLRCAIIRLLQSPHWKQQTRRSISDGMMIEAEEEWTKESDRRMDEERGTSERINNGSQHNPGEPPNKIRHSSSCFDSRVLSSYHHANKVLPEKNQEKCPNTSNQAKRQDEKKSTSHTFQPKWSVPRSMNQPEGCASPSIPNCKHEQSCKIRAFQTQQQFSQNQQQQEESTEEKWLASDLSLLLLLLMFRRRSSKKKRRGSQAEKQQ